MTGLAFFADRLSALMASTRDPQGIPWTNASLASEVTTQGVEVTPQHISSLRSGARDNPSARLVVALAKALQVPTTYLLEEDAEAPEETIGIRLRSHGEVSVEQLAALVREVLRQDSDPPS